MGAKWTTKCTGVLASQTPKVRSQMAKFAREYKGNHSIEILEPWYIYCKVCGVFASCMQRMIRVDHALVGGICTRGPKLMEANTKTLHGKNYSVVAHLEAFIKADFDEQDLYYRITGGREGKAKYNYELPAQKPDKPQAKECPKKGSKEAAARKSK